jgi:alpha-galactosidase
MSDIDDFTLSLLTNNEVIAVNQDPLAAPVTKLLTDNGRYGTRNYMMARMQ